MKKMPVPLAVSAGLKYGLPFLSGLFGGGKNEQESTTKQNVDLTDTGTSSSSGSRSRTFDPAALPLINPLVARTLEQLNAPINFDTAALDRLQLIQGDQANAVYEGAGANLAASLAARGLTNSPGVQAVSQANLQGQRANTLSGIAGNIAQQKFELPLLQEQIRQGRIASTLPVLNTFAGEEFDQSGTSTNRRTGTTTTDTRGTGTGPSGFGAGFNNLAQSLAFNSGYQLPKNISNNVGEGLPDFEPNNVQFELPQFTPYRG